MKTKKLKNYRFWLGVGTAGFLLTAPQTMFLRVAVQELDPHLLNALRFGVVALLALPFVLRSRSRLTRGSVKYVLISGVGLSIAASSLVFALRDSQASYVSFLLLLSPAVLVAYSMKMDSERVALKAVVGIMISLIGALVLAGLPALMFGEKKILYPLATALLLLNALVYPFVTLSYKWANEREKIPLPVIIGLSAGVVSVTSLGFWLFSGSVWPAHVSSVSVLAVLYSGVIVSLTSKVLSVAAFKRIGAAGISSLNYLQSFLAVLLPVIFLHERLTSSMIIGGLLIVVGVVLAQKHGLVVRSPFGRRKRNGAKRRLKKWPHNPFAS